MKKRILFINPPVLTVFEPWFDEPKFVRTSIAFLAGYLREHGDFEIKCLDAKFEKISFKQVAEIAREFQPDFIALTAFTNEIKPAAYQAGLLKRILPGAVVIIGGPHVTAIPQQTMREFPTFDVGVVGEGEETLLELCNTISRGGSLEKVEGIVYRTQDNAICQTPLRPRILNPDTLPMPAWDLLPAAEEYYIQSVRGCPFNCVFCMNHNGRVARKRSVEKTVAEIEWIINEFGAKRISFSDELFSVDMQRTADLMDLMIERGIGKKVSWDIQTHVAFVNDSLFEKMKAANVEKVEMGVETGDELLLKRMGKATNVDMIMKAFRSADRHDIKTGSFLLLGQPNETHRSIWKTISLAIKINPTEPIFGTMVPYPGTEVANLAAKGEGGFKLITTNWDEYNKQFNGSLEFTNISRTALEWYQIFGYVSVFIANLRVMDLLKFIWSYRVGAFKLLGKALTRKRSVREMMNIPDDYEAVINSNAPISINEMTDARVAWKRVQSAEVQRTKREAPYLLKEQLPV